MDKDPDAFRTISEVADELDVPQHVLRFWETRFSQIKPMKRGGGRRYYRPNDVDLLKGIKHLLYGEGYTIKGVQRILRESGVRHVQAIWREEEAAAEQVAAEAVAGDERAEAATVSQKLMASLRAAEAEEPDEATEPASRPVIQGPLEDAAEPGAVAGQSDEDLKRDLAFWVQQRESDTAAKPEEGGDAETAPIAFPRIAALSVPPGGLSEEGMRQIKAALYELAECRRILDTVRES